MIYNFILISSSERLLEVKRKKHHKVVFVIMYPHQESDLDLLLRRESFYPLNYGGNTSILLITIDKIKKNGIEIYLEIIYSVFVSCMVALV